MTMGSQTRGGKAGCKTEKKKKRLLRYYQNMIKWLPQASRD